MGAARRGRLVPRSRGPRGRAGGRRADTAAAAAAPRLPDPREPRPDVGLDALAGRAVVVVGLERRRQRHRERRRPARERVARLVIGRHLAAFAHFIADIALAPTVTTRGETVTRTDSQAILDGGGVGASYYFEPWNLVPGPRSSRARSATSISARATRRTSASAGRWRSARSGAVPGEKWGLGVGAQLFAASLYDLTTSSRFDVGGAVARVLRFV